jgi:hypothetical protein
MLTRLPGWTQDQPNKSVSTEQLKKLLDELKRKYTESKDGDFIINVPRPGAADVDYRCFLYSFQKGKAVVITCNGLVRGDESFRLKAVQANEDAAVADLLDKINQWNINKSLSRAIMSRGVDNDGKKICYARLEADIDWELGVTDKKIDALIKQFTKSLGEFDTFLGNDPRRFDAPTGPVFIDKGGQEIVNFPLSAAGGNAEGDKIQASWRIHYAVERKNGLCVTGAWFKKKGDAEWFKVLEDLRVSMLYIPYEDKSPRYFDMDLAVPPYTKHGPWGLGQMVGPDQNLIGPYGKKVSEFVVRENRDAGLLWLFNDGHEMEISKDTKPRVGKTFAFRRQEMVLWSVFQATNYFYIMQFGFHNDGTVTCRLGSTGQNLHNHDGKGTGHMHNTGWRVQLDLGGSGPDAPEKKLADKLDVFRVTHIEKPEGKGRASTEESPILASEGSVDWTAEEFTLMRVRNPKAVNELKHPVNYDLVPLRQGTARHFAEKRDYDADNRKTKKLNRPSDEFTRHDFWVTNPDPAYTNYEHLPTYVKDSKKLGDNAVLWHWSSNLHIPRDEDFTGPERTGQKRTKGCAVVMWSGFDLRPRNLFSGTPFLKG